MGLWESASRRSTRRRMFPASPPGVEAPPHQRPRLGAPRSLDEAGPAEGGGESCTTEHCGHRILPRLDRIALHDLRTSRTGELDRRLEQSDGHALAAIRSRDEE